MRHNNVRYSRIRKIILLMRDYEYYSCSYCTGTAGKSCRDMKCVLRFADQSRYMIDKQEVLHGSH